MPGMELNITLEFGGGAEFLFNNVKKQNVTLDGNRVKNIADLLIWMKDNILAERPELFIQDGSVRPGILVLINDADWELMGELEYEIQPNDSILFISTLHGGENVCRIMPLPKWGSSYRSLYERNQILLNNEELSDIKFQFEDNSILFGHKFILASRSPVFEKMFFNWPTEENLVQIDFTTANIFFHFLQYLYTDCVTWMRGYNVGAVMATAHKYGVNHLEGLCYDYMLRTLSIENACTYLEHCYPFNNKFTNKLYSFIDEKCEAIILQESFFNLTIKPLLSIVTRNSLVVQENNLFNQLLNNLHMACKNSRPNSNNQIVFDQVRFPTMTTYEFDRCVRLAPNFFTEKQKVDIYNYIVSGRCSEQDLQFPTTKREWKLLKECVFAAQEYNCTEGNKRLSMRFRLKNTIELKEIELYWNENCTYLIELINDYTDDVMFITHGNEVTFSCDSLKLPANTTYVWKTHVYCTNSSSIRVSQGNNKFNTSNTIISCGKGRSIIKKMTFVNK